MSEGREYRHWGQVGISALIGGIALDLAWYGIAAAQPRYRLPLWPLIPLSVLAVAGLYLVVAPVFGAPVPLYKEERDRRRRQQRKQEEDRRQAEADAAWRAGQEEERRLARERWTARAANMRLGTQPTISIDLYCPPAWPSEHLEGATAECQVTQSANVFQGDHLAEYEPRHRAFSLAFPQHFLPAPAQIVPGEYHVTWRSDALDEPITAIFRIDRFGMVEK